MRGRRSGATKELPFGTKTASARGTMALGSASLGAASFGAVAIGALGIRHLAIRRAKIRHLSIEDLAVGRLRVRELIIEEQRNEPRPFEDLQGHNYVNLTTFRKSGEAVSAPVWFALVSDVIYVTTPPNSGKMKRIRNNPRVMLTPCNAWGKPCGKSIAGFGRAIDGSAPKEAKAALHEKYRLGLALFHLFGKREVGEVVPLEIHPTKAHVEGA